MRQTTWPSDEGMASCGDVDTWEIRWQERLGGMHLASLLYAEGRVYFFTLDGKTSVLKAGKQFEKLAENKLEEPLVATPAVVDEAIFLRTDRYFYRIGKKSASTAWDPGDPGKREGEGG